MNSIIRKTEDTIRSIREYELEKDLFLIQNKSDTYKNLELSFSKKNLCHFIIKKEVEEHTEYILQKEADICIGFITSEKCKLYIYFKKNKNDTNLFYYETITCSIGKNNLLQNFLYFGTSPNYYHDFYIKSDKNVELKIIYTFLQNDIRSFICQNNIQL